MSAVVIGRTWPWFAENSGLGEHGGGGSTQLMVTKCVCETPPDSTVTGWLLRRVVKLSAVSVMKWRWLDVPWMLYWRSVPDATCVNGTTSEGPWVALICTLRSQ